MTRNEVVKIIKNIYQEKYGDNLAINEETKLISCSCNNIKLSSLNLIGWLIYIENYFNIEITEEDKCVKDIINKVMERQKD